MTEISAGLVRELREKTQAGMMDCKKALQETGGDFDAAIKYLREKGLSAAAKRADRAASQGSIDVKFNDAKTSAVLFELNSETDFVARNEKFRALLNQLMDQVLAQEPPDVSALETQAFIGDNSKKVADLVTDAIAVIGENIIARRFAFFKAASGNQLESYIHMGGTIGVLLELSGNADKALAKDIAMHIAAASPQYLDRSAVPAEQVQAEKEIYKNQLLQDEKNKNKPANILDKIIEGKANKFYEEICLLEQAFIKDPEKKIRDILPEGVVIARFARFQLGV